MFCWQRLSNELDDNCVPRNPKPGHTLLSSWNTHPAGVFWCPEERGERRGGRGGREKRERREKRREERWEIFYVPEIRAPSSAARPHGPTGTPIPGECTAAQAQPPPPPPPALRDRPPGPGPRPLPPPAAPAEPAAGPAAAVGLRTVRKGGALAAAAVETQGKGDVLAAAAVETQGKGDFLAAAAVGTQGKGGAFTEASGVLAALPRPEEVEFWVGVDVRPPRLCGRRARRCVSLLIHQSSSTSRKGGLSCSKTVPFSAPHIAGMMCLPPTSGKAASGRSSTATSRCLAASQCCGAGDPPARFSGSSPRTERWETHTHPRTHAHTPAHARTRPHTQYTAQKIE